MQHQHNSDNATEDNKKLEMIKNNDHLVTPFDDFLADKYPILKDLLGRMPSLLPEKMSIKDSCCCDKVCYTPIIEIFADFNSINEANYHISWNRFSQFIHKNCKI